MKPPVEGRGRRLVALRKPSGLSSWTAVPRKAAFGSAPVVVPNSRFAAVSASALGSAHRQPTLRSCRWPVSTHFRLVSAACRRVQLLHLRDRLLVFDDCPLLSAFIGPRPPESPQFPDEGQYVRVSVDPASSEEVGYRTRSCNGARHCRPTLLDSGIPYGLTRLARGRGWQICTSHG